MPGRETRGTLGGAGVEGATAQQVLDDDRARHDGAKAALAAAEAQVAAADAAIGTADSHVAGAQAGEVLAVGGRVQNMVDLSDVYMTFFLPTEAAVMGPNSSRSEARI